MFEKKILTIIYDKAQSAEDLIWHSEEPAKLLKDAVSQRETPGRALDIGCGAGTFSIYLAKQGYEVTGLDFIPKALDMARRRADSEGVQINWVMADLLEWTSPHEFDLVLDSGCLHNISAGNLARYKERLLGWLAPGSDFVLAHFGKKHTFDWRPVGPKRRTREQLIGLFSPEMREKAYEQELMTGIPFPIGPTIMTQSFWFQRSD